jgi:hypothetical protein
MENYSNAVMIADICLNRLEPAEFFKNKELKQMFENV